MKRSLILKKDSKILRKIAKPVSPKEIGSKKLEAILSKMSKALHKEEDGVALAAPQVGVSLRMFIISGVTLGALSHASEEAPLLPDLVFINPMIVKLSRKKKLMEEGCLSVRWQYGKVERSEKATVKALDQSGKMFTIGASGLLAQIFQHEVDHLDGVLFIDKAKDLEEVPPTSPVSKKK